jgi:AraC family transcriptional regulator, transcriptional activator of pobA
LYYSCMIAQSHIPLVQTYNLFGESEELPDVVHCESIAVRSTLHNWEFAPHRHARLHQILLITHGGGKASIEGSVSALSPLSLLNVPAGCVHGFSFLKDTRGWVVTLADTVLDDVLKESEGVAPLLKQPRILLADKDTEGTFQRISREHADLGYARAHILRALSGLLIGQVARAISQSQETSGKTPELNLRTQFEALVDRQYAQHWGVSDYARELAVSPGHLSRVMRRATGFSASRLIAERVVREARRHLAYTNLTVSEIAYELGFIDPAYFSRVFSRSTGISPRAFRARLAARG